MSLLIYLPVIYTAYKFGKGVYLSATAAPVAGATTTTFMARASAFFNSVF